MMAECVPRSKDTTRFHLSVTFSTELQGFMSNTPSTLCDEGGNLLRARKYHPAGMGRWVFIPVKMWLNGDLTL